MFCILNALYICFSFLLFFSPPLCILSYMYVIVCIIVSSTVMRVNPMVDWGISKAFVFYRDMPVFSSVFFFVWKKREFDDILLRYCNTVYNQNTIDRWTKGCIPPFPKKGDLRIAKNYRSIAANIYNALLRNRIEPKIEKILRKNQNSFRRNRSTTSQILTIRQILKVCVKPRGNTIIRQLLQSI